MKIKTLASEGHMAATESSHKGMKEQLDVDNCLMVNFGDEYI